MPRETYNTTEGSISSNGRLIANRELIDRSKTMSRNMTKAEQLLWFNVLSKRQLWGYKFTRQTIVGQYILDFYCSELLLVIEADGESHSERQEYDLERDEYIRNLGIETIRINNSDIYTNLWWIHEYLTKKIKERYPRPEFSGHPLDRGN